MDDFKHLEPILIVDDMPEMCEYLAHILSGLGFTHVAHATDFKATKALLANTQPQTVFLDIELPDSNGKDILSFITTHHPHTHVIMCSGHNSIQNVQETWELGAKGFIAKPFNAKKIDTVIKRLELFNAAV